MGQRRNQKILSNGWKQKHSIPKLMEDTESSTQKFITLNENIKKEKISSLTFHLMKLAKEQQTKPKARIRKEIINI